MYLYLTLTSAQSDAENDSWNYRLFLLSWETQVEITGNQELCLSGCILVLCSAQLVWGH
jgi:hypothetical protein